MTDRESSLEGLTINVSAELRQFAFSDHSRALVPLVIALVAVGGFSQASTGKFLGVHNLQNIFEQVAVLGMLGIGSTLLLVGGQLDLSVASSVSLFSVVAALLLERDMSEAAVAVIVIAGAALVGAINGLLITLTRVEPFIFTLGMMNALAAIALIISNNAPVQSGLAFAWMSIGKVGPFPVPGLMFVGLSLVAWALLLYTRFGRNAYAIGSNNEAAFLAGVPVASTKIGLYALSGALAGVGALLLVARLGSGDPNGAIGLELKAITAVVLGGATLAGGRGSILGSFLGVLLLGVISNALTLAGVPNSFSTLVLGGVLMVAVIWAAVSRQRRITGRPLFRMSEFLRKHR